MTTNNISWSLGPVSNSSFERPSSLLFRPARRVADPTANRNLRGVTSPRLISSASLPTFCLFPVRTCPLLPPKPLKKARNAPSRPQNLVALGHTFPNASLRQLSSLFPWKRLQYYKTVFTHTQPHHPLSRPFSPRKIVLHSRKIPLRSVINLDRCARMYSALQHQPTHLPIALLPILRLTPCFPGLPFPHPHQCEPRGLAPFARIRAI
jgi:hypothetical protein